MPMPLKDISGKRFGRLIALSLIHTNRNSSVWLCRCDCGITKKVRLSELRSGKTASCGCYRSEVKSKEMRCMATTHNQSSTRTYRIWQAMIQRCTNPKRRGYEMYGGAGIKVCARWRKFENFLADMGEAPTDKSIDRFPNGSNYEPGKCRWATTKEQAANRKTTRRTA